MKNILNRVKIEIKAIWKIESNRRMIKDVLLLSCAAIIFHILYWNTNMNSWIFGPYTQEIYDFFRHLAFNGSLLLCGNFIDKPFVVQDTVYHFYYLMPNGLKVYDLTMNINVDCSGVKQLLQWLLIMILCRGKWWKKGIYFVIGCIVILFFNIIRIYLLTSLFADHPEMFQWVHDWIARPMMYVIIFSMWLLWISYFASKKPNTTKEKA